MQCPEGKWGSCHPDLSEEEIIRIYGKCWQIEVFFKTCKSYLNLVSECHSLSYDALIAHVAIVFARYMMLALEQRKDEITALLGKSFSFCQMNWQISHLENPSRSY